MGRYFLRLAYEGTAYHGWQVQPEDPTVQGTLEHALSVLLKDTVSITGAGRTDTGVHASDYYAHFDRDKSLDTTDLRYKLNRFLPADILIKDIFPVSDDSHARFSALSRTYHYIISRIKPLFNRNFVHYLYSPLDLEAIKQCCLYLKDCNDFTSFSKLHSDNKTNLCLIENISWQATDEGYRFEITADRFLRDMVRAIVGTLIDVGSGRTGVEEFKKIVAAKDRSAAGMSAPARGLFLVDISYPDGILP